MSAEFDLLMHKKNCIEMAIQASKQIPNYPLRRVIGTINGDDADDIPKVEGAGEIFEEEGVRYQLMHNGVKVLERCYYGAWMTDIIYALRGHHEPQEEKVFHEVLKWIPKGATMLELGAYWCYYSLWFSTVILDANNYVMEPHAENLEVGKKNFKLNHKKAHFLNAYLGLTSLGKFMGVRRLSVDEFLNENKIDQLAILHADIQGGEHDMLLSSVEAIKMKKIDYFFISTHGSKVHKACRDFLLMSDYMIIAEHEKHQSCSGDGLIVARRKDIQGPDHISIRKY